MLEVIVESAARFCDAEDVTIFELDGQDLRKPPTGVRSRKRSVIIIGARAEVLVAVP